MSIPAADESTELTAMDMTDVHAAVAAFRADPAPSARIRLGASNRIERLHFACGVLRDMTNAGRLNNIPCGRCVDTNK